MRLHRPSLFIFILLHIFGTQLYACRWCFDNRVKTVVAKEFSKDFFVSPSKRPSPLTLERAPQDDTVEEQSNEEQPNIDVAYQPTPEGADFYKEGVLENYPKAFVFRYVYFPTMCPKAIDVALQEIVNVLTFEDWFFFTNKKQGFRWGVHWERIITVCKILNNFFNRTYVEPDTLMVFERRIKSGPGLPTKGCSRLRNYFKENGYTAVYDFYALYFDYVIKLFNEGIKFKNRKKVNKYYYSLLSIMPKIRPSTKHKAKYTNALKRVKRLRKLFLDEDRQRRKDALRGKRK